MVTPAVTKVKSEALYCAAAVPWNKLPDREEGTCGCLASWFVGEKAFCKRHGMAALWKAVVEGEA